MKGLVLNVLKVFNYLFDNKFSDSNSKKRLKIEIKVKKNFPQTTSFFPPVILSSSYCCHLPVPIQSFCFWICLFVQLAPVLFYKGMLSLRMGRYTEISCWVEHLWLTYEVKFRKKILIYTYQISHLLGNCLPKIIHVIETFGCWLTIMSCVVSCTQYLCLHGCLK